MWLTLILVAVAIAVVSQIRLSIEFVFLQRRQVLLEELLVQWAIGWNDSPEQLQPKLLAIVKRFRPDMLPRPKETTGRVTTMSCAVPGADVLIDVIDAGWDRIVCAIKRWRNAHGTT